MIFPLRASPARNEKNENFLETAVVMQLVSLITEPLGSIVCPTCPQHVNARADSCSSPDRSGAANHCSKRSAKHHTSSSSHTAKAVSSSSAPNYTTKTNPALVHVG